jgi:DNA-binding NtrC family response regulator
MATQRVTNVVARENNQSRARLRVLGGGSFLEFDVPRVGLVVGADRSCDVVLTDRSVSRKHVSVVPKETGFEITDMGSTNGTFVDDLAIEKVVVPEGTTIRAGDTLLQLLPAEAAVELAPSAATHFGDMIGGSLAMRKLYAVLGRASQSNVPVLCSGESGTGKELAARALHEQGPRAKGPFVVFDCGAASDTLMESELFGHKRGAFTGADSDRAGAFAQAHGGTLFLDEIGDLPLALQPKLLRMLERQEVTPLGSGRSERFDVRFVAATHRDLWSDVREGTFRGDLFYRLSVIEAHMPSLRHRKDDIADLVRMFLRAAGRSDEGVEGPALIRLQAYPWPGNVRELRNVIGRAAALGAPKAPFAELPMFLRAGVEPLADGAPMPLADVPFHDAKAEVNQRFERAYLEDLLRRAGTNISEAARIAGLERKYLYKLLEKNGLLPRRAAGTAAFDDEGR